jgi:taurine--2-oxoglutarate transaminase
MLAKRNSEQLSPKELHQQFRQMEKDYVLHSWCIQNQYDSPVVVGGEGATFWDMDGKHYLDFSSQAMCNTLGHQHPRVVEAIQKQAGELCFVQGTWATIPRARLAKKLIQVCPPNMGKVFFTTGGSEANENAIKLARFYTGKQKIISRYRSYHGASAGSMTLSGDPRRWPVEPGITGVVRAMDCYCYRCSFGLEPSSCNLRCAEHIAELIMLEGKETVAAVIVEPIVGSNGILVPPDGYLPRVREICTENDVLLICDEVMTGFGRTGAWFASQHWNVVPDMITTAKGLTAAMIPLGALIISKEMASFFEDKMLFAGLTYLGHPLACAAGEVALDVYEEEGLIEKSRLLGEYMLKRLEEMKHRHLCIGDVRGKGLFATIELVKDKVTRAPLADFNHGSPAIGRIVAEARDRGICFSARWNFFIFAPPLVISQQEVDCAMDMLDELLVYTDNEAEILGGRVE